MGGERVLGVGEFANFYDRQSGAVRRSFRGRSVEELDGWLFGIARHQLARYFRRGRAERSALARLQVRVPRVAGDDLARIEELAGLDQLRTVLSVELARLTGEEREALQLRVVEELPYAVVAQRLAVSEQTARKRVSRALRRLFESLDPVPLPGQERT
jgi:RNA polymerase sigma factor (sigma-70 family)